jgi:hypothetical protein
MSPISFNMLELMDLLSLRLTARGNTEDELTKGFTPKLKDPIFLSLTVVFFILREISVLLQPTQP